MSKNVHKLVILCYFCLHEIYYFNNNNHTKKLNRMKIKNLLCIIALCLLWMPGKAQQFSVMTLRNGATVYIWEDKNQPDVFGMISFKVGSVDDPEQYTGLAHYLEHVMFKGTQTIDALDWEKEKPIYEQIIAKYDERAALTDQDARDAIDLEINELTREAAQYAAGNEFSLLVDHMGGKGLNASTGYDQTEYHNSFPPSQLEKWLEIYSERLIDPVFRGFQTELEAVYEEYNMYNDNRSSRLQEFIYEQAFGDHPYGRPIIGLAEHLKNPQLSKLIEFYNTWYGPQNMSIILVGNIDAKEAIPMIREKFERVPRRAEIHRVKKPVPQFKGRTEKSAKIFYYPMLALIYNGVPSNDKDEIALEICCELLSNSQRTGILDKLQLDGDLMSVGAGQNAMRDAGIVMINAIPYFDANQNRWDSHKSVEKLLLSTLSQLQNGEFDEATLNAIKQNMMREYDLQMESNETKAYILASLFNTGADPADIINYKEKVNAVTIDEVKAVAKKYFTNNYLALNIQEAKQLDSKSKKLKKPAYKPIETKKGEKSEYAKWVESIPVNMPEVKYCDFNSIQQKKINTRSKLFYNFNPENDVFTMTLRYGVGTRKMPKLEYAVELMNNAGMLPDVEPLAFKRAMSELNANCTYAVDDNYMYVMMSGYEHDLVKACQLLSKQILFPKLDDKQLQSLIGNVFGARQMEREDIGTLENALVSYVLYKDSSDYLQRLPIGDLISLSITDLTTQFQSATNYECEIYYTGTAPFDDVYQVLSQNLPLMAQEIPSTSPELRSRQQYNENTIFFLPNNKATQSKIYFFIEGQPFEVKDDIFIEAFSNYFGSGFGSLVLDEIREKRAMAYTAYGVISTPAVAGRNNLFQGFVGTQGDKTIDAIDIYMSLLNDMPEMPEHFDVVKTNIEESILSAKPGFRSASAVYEAWKRKGYTQDPAIDKMKKIETLKFEDIVNYYNENIKGKPIVIAIVGNPKDFDTKALEKYGKVVKVSESRIFSDNDF